MPRIYLKSLRPADLLVVQPFELPPKQRKGKEGGNRRFYPLKFICIVTLIPNVSFLTFWFSNFELNCTFIQNLTPRQFFWTENNFVCDEE